MEFETFFQILIFIVVRGLINTLVLASGSFLLGLILGSLLTFMQIFSRSIISRTIDIVTRFLRSIPPILMLFIIFYGLRINNVIAAIIGLGLVSSAYQSQILKGIVDAVSARQLDAALSIGLSMWQAFRYVILPQTLLLAIPALLNEFATVLKDTSIAYAIGVVEIFTISVILANARMEYILPLSSVALVYLTICLSVSVTANTITKKLRSMGYGVEV